MTAHRQEATAGPSFEYEKYRAEKLEVAKSLFEMTREMYSSDELAKGVYAEVHDLHDDMFIIGLKPKTETHLVTRMEYTAHSVFDEMRGKRDYQPGSPIDELPELLQLVKVLGLGHRTSIVHGKYFEAGGLSEFCVFGAINPLSESVYRQLNENFDLDNSTLHRGRTAEPRKVHYDREPHIEPALTFTELTTDQRPVETGISNGISFYRTIDYIHSKYAQSDNSYIGPQISAYIDFFCSNDRTHDPLSDRALNFIIARVESSGLELPPETTKEELINDYIAFLKQGSTLSPDVLSADQLPEYKIFSRYMIDHEMRMLKVEAVITTPKNETDQLNPEFIKIGAILLCAVVCGLAEERRASGFETSASLIINTYDANGDIFTYSNTIKLDHAPVSLVMTKDGNTHGLSQKEIIEALQTTGKWISYQNIQ
jgi:hypothetical protein